MWLSPSNGACSTHHHHMSICTVVNPPHLWSILSSSCHHKKISETNAYRERGCISNLVVIQHTGPPVQWTEWELWTGGGKLSAYPVHLGGVLRADQPLEVAHPQLVETEHDQVGQDCGGRGERLKGDHGNRFHYIIIDCCSEQKMSEIHSPGGQTKYSIHCS